MLTSSVEWEQITGQGHRFKVGDFVFVTFIDENNHFYEDFAIVEEVVEKDESVLYTVFLKGYNKWGNVEEHGLRFAGRC